MYMYNVLSSLLYVMFLRLCLLFQVSLVLHGDMGMSETRELVLNTNGSQPLFERNSRDTFVISLPENLGRIFKVQIWHNNAGAHPSWYLSRCIVRDVIRGECACESNNANECV